MTNNDVEHDVLFHYSQLSLRNSVPGAFFFIPKTLLCSREVGLIQMKYCVFRCSNSIYNYVHKSMSNFDTIIVCY